MFLTLTLVFVGGLVLTAQPANAVTGGQTSHAATVAAQ